MCDGSLDSILFIAEIASHFGCGNQWSSLTLFLLAICKTTRQWTQQRFELVPSSLSRDDIALYCTTFQEPLQLWQEMCWVFTRAQGALQYVYNWGPDNYVLDSLSDSPAGTSYFTCGPAITLNYPLLAVKGESKL